jgi:acetate---CoA ligase (ADP-forming)
MQGTDGAEASADSRGDESANTALWTADELKSIGKIVHPRSIAIVGASPHEGSYGGRFLTASLRASDRVRVYPVNPNYGQIADRRCYPSVSELPEIPDVVGVAVRHDRVLPVLRESHAHGVKSAIVVSAGFAERGEDVRGEVQRQLGEFARVSGLRVCGPNCLGVANVAEDIWSCAGSLDYLTVNKPPPGRVGVICQSGAVGFATIAPRAADLGVGLSHLITTGNEADLEFSDFARYLLDDDETDVIAGFVEGFKDVPKFVEVCRMAAQRGKPLVLIKIGRAQEGSRAARSHTAALTGADETFAALFEQFGVVRVRDYEELLSVANLFSRCGRPAERGVALVSHSGGLSSLTADLFGAAGMELPSLSEPARSGISNLLGGFGWAANPADITQLAWRDEFRDVIRHLISEPEVGTLVVASTPSEKQVAAMASQRAASSKAMVYLWSGSHSGRGGEEQSATALQQLTAAGIPVFFAPAQLADALRQFYGYYDWLDRYREDRTPRAPELAPSQRGLLGRLAGLGRQNLTERESGELARAWGIPVATAFEAATTDEAAAAAQRVGYPVVLKIDSPDIAHKSDAGLVHVDLATEQQVRQAFQAIADSGRRQLPPGAELRVLVQEMVRGGLELVAGVHRDPQAGPLLLCGAGGVFVELYRDVSRRLCPVSAEVAAEMLTELRVAMILDGFRGRPALDEQAVVDTLVHLSELAVSAADYIDEIEINPLIVLPKGEGVRAVDALVTLRSLR